MICRVRIAPLKHYEVTADAVDELELRLEREEEGVRAVGHEHEECRREDHGLELRELLRADGGARPNNRTRRHAEDAQRDKEHNATQQNTTQRATRSYPQHRTRAQRPPDRTHRRHRRRGRGGSPRRVGCDRTARVERHTRPRPRSATEHPPRLERDASSRRSGTLGPAAGGAAAFFAARLDRATPPRRERPANLPKRPLVENPSSGAGRPRDEKERRR